MMEAMETRELVILNRHNKRMPATVYEAVGESRGFAIALHGLGGWRAQSVVVAAATAAAREGYTTLTFDAADGASAPDASFETSTTTGFLQDLEDVIRYAKEEGMYQEPFMLLGHSLGGMIASRYTATHPDAVSRLVLIAPAVSWKLYTKWFIPYGVWWFVLDAHHTLGPGGVRLPLRRSWLVDFFKYDIREDRAHITIPVLVVMGEKDGVIGTPSTLRAYAKGFSGGSFSLIPNAGHTFKDHEAEVTDTIHTWLTSS